MKAQVFQSGNSQAIRIPKPFRLASRTVSIERVPQGLLIVDLDAVAERAKVFAALAGSCPDFPEIDSNDAPNLPRDLE